MEFYRPNPVSELASYFFHSFFINSLFFSKNKISAYRIAQKIGKPTTSRYAKEVTQWVFYFDETNKGND